MHTVLGEFGRQQSNDFTKIQARFKTQTYTDLLTEISTLAAQARATSGAWAGDGRSVAETRVEYIAKSTLSIRFQGAYLATEADVVAYLADLKRAMLAALEDGKRIQI